jgi:hypothetical protein
MDKDTKPVWAPCEIPSSYNNLQQGETAESRFSDLMQQCDQKWNATGSRLSDHDIRASAQKCPCKQSPILHLVDQSRYGPYLGHITATFFSSIFCKFTDILEGSFLNIDNTVYEYLSH